MLLGVHPAVFPLYAAMMWVGYNVRPLSRTPNDAALAMLVAWGAAEVFCQMTGEKLPLRLYFLLDAAAICFLIDETRQKLTRCVLGLYVVCWAIYVFVGSDRLQWFLLLAVTTAQFILIGWQGHLRGFRDDVDGLASGQGSMAGRYFDPVQADLQAVEADSGRPLSGELGQAPANGGRR